MAKHIKKGSHCDKILEYLKFHESGLTSWECIKELEIQYLPQRIKELEQKGYMIDRTSVETATGKVTRYTYSKDNTD